MAKDCSFDVVSEVDMQEKKGITKENAKEVVKAIKNMKIKVQASIQEDQVRVSGKDKDDLQAVIQMLKQLDIPVELQFVNFRS